MSAIKQLIDFGQSPWNDNLTRALATGGLRDLIAEHGMRGVTSNPTIFEKAMAQGNDYDAQLREVTARAESPIDAYWDLVTTDIAHAADLLRPTFDELDGADGFVSVEVSPDLAHDTDGTISQAKELWDRLDRPNVMIKIPATEAGIPAIEDAIAEGININVTLMFSVDIYRRVARAYVAGLRRRLERGESVNVASVASFFVSRVDTKVDRYLDEIGTDQARAARGRAAIANAKMAYESFTEIFGGEEFADLRAAGARVQRCLWASTSTKNPDYRDVLYVEELIGPDTVDTMPLETITAFLDHGHIERTLDRDLDHAHEAIRAVEAQGITMERVTAELIDEGVSSFSKSFDELIETIESKREELAPA